MSIMNANPEAWVIREWLKEDTNCWIAIATAFLQRYDRDVAIQKISVALQYLLRDGPPAPTTLGGRLFRAGVRRINYDLLALELVLATEAVRCSHA